MMKPNPRTICIVASVAISALMRNREITTPLQSPTAPPTNTPANMPNKTLPIALVTTAATTPAQATTEPTDKSKSPDAKQNSIVQPTMPICDTANAKPFTFTHEKKSSTNSEHAANSTAKTTNMPAFSQRSAIAPREAVGEFVDSVIVFFSVSRFKQETPVAPIAGPLPHRLRRGR